MPMERIITKQVRLVVPDSRVPEMRQRIESLLDPSSMCFNDQYAHDAFRRDFGMSVDDAQELLGERYVHRARWVKKK